jgi:SAM-dependent methyltransferase
MPARTEVVDWYELPAAYDALFAEGTRREARFLEAVAREHGRGLRGRPLRVLEPACGSGRLVLALAARGHRVAGFDLSEAMLDHAERRLARRGLSARLWRDDLASFEAPRAAFDLAHCLVSTFKYVLDERGARAHLRRAARALRPGGLYVLGLHLTEYGRQSVQVERWEASRGRTKFVSRARIEPAERGARRERVRLTLRIEGPRGTRRTAQEWWFRTYDEREIARLVASVPVLELVETFDFDCDPARPGAEGGRRLDRVLVLRRRPRPGG